jgi:hypothetical protein
MGICASLEVRPVVAPQSFRSPDMNSGRAAPNSCTINARAAAPQRKTATDASPRHRRMLEDVITDLQHELSKGSRQARRAVATTTTALSYRPVALVGISDEAGTVRSTTILSHTKNPLSTSSCHSENRRTSSSSSITTTTTARAVSALSSNTTTNTLQRSNGVHSNPLVCSLHQVESSEPPHEQQHENRDSRGDWSIQSNMMYDDGLSPSVVVGGGNVIPVDSLLYCGSQRALERDGANLGQPQDHPPPSDQRQGELISVNRLSATASIPETPITSVSTLDAPLPTIEASTMASLQQLFEDARVSRQSLMPSFSLRPEVDKDGGGDDDWHLWSS